MTTKLTQPDWEVRTCDCRDGLVSLSAESVDLVFADPPFNIDQDYIGYTDAVSNGEYEDFTFEWIIKARTTVRPGGLLCVHGNDDVAANVLYLCHAWRRLAWIIWHYRFGQCRQTNWINSKAHCIVYRRANGQTTWNPDAVAVPSDRASKYNDERTKQSATPGMRVPGDVWGVPSDGKYWGRVQGNSRERRKGHPNQLPEVYLERIVKAYTNPGDLVVDPFVGSGTTGVVAVALGRRFIGFEISEESAASARERIKQGAVRIRP